MKRQTFQEFLERRERWMSPERAALLGLPWIFNPWSAADPARLTIKSLLSPGSARQRRLSTSIQEATCAEPVGEDGNSDKAAPNLRGPIVRITDGTCIQSEQDEIYARLRLVLADIERIQTGQLQGLGRRSGDHSALAGLVRCEFLLTGLEAVPEDE